MQSSTPNILTGFALAVFTLALLLSPSFSFHAEATSAAATGKLTAADVADLQWIHLSSKTGAIEPPGAATQQTAALILDIDGDGKNDFVIGSRRAQPALVWYRQQQNGWARHIIENATMDIEAGGTHHDIDGDGDLDVVMGGDSRSNEIWWWENPAPNFEPTTPWSRHLIKSSGSTKHHDQIFGDFDGDGQAELVFWNQKAQALFLAEIPADPRSATSWPLTQIYSWSGGTEHEGLAKADIDGDGILDIIGGGHWFKFATAGSYTPHLIDDSQRFSRVAVGQLIPGGPPEVVLGCGDCTGPLQWYELRNNAWVGHALLDNNIKKGHSLALADFDGDGALDIFAAEMRLHDNNAQAKSWILLGDNQGGFTPTVVTTGFGHHESKVGDLNGDGTIDILGKPYNWETPRLDIWLNQRDCDRLTQWERQVVDPQRPWRTLFVRGGDINKDGYADIATGGWWYKNPGSSGGSWERQTIGEPLNNLALLYDFDQDGDLDAFGTQGRGSDSNARFAWAQNDGQGNFQIFTNIAEGEGDFLQGVAVGEFQANQLGVALSWHVDDVGVQLLSVPNDPSRSPWNWQRLSTTSQDEALSAGDIDRDGNLDLLLGTTWLRNNGTSQWEPLVLHETRAAPDRNRLGDVNGDGRLDAIVGYEATNRLGLLAWYEQPETASATWTEHEIATITGPMSLDVADMDQDGDLDVVVGEHNFADPASAALYLFENRDGRGNEWQQHLIHMGDEHHDGAQVLDIDADGDLDVFSIGWRNDQVLLYENRGEPCQQEQDPTATATAPTLTPSPSATLIATSPTATPTPTDVILPSPTATSTPLDTPTVDSTPTATAESTTAPTVEPTTEPTTAPTTEPTTAPTTEPTANPTVAPTANPTEVPAAVTCVDDAGLISNPGFEAGIEGWKLKGKKGSLGTDPGTLNCGAAASVSLETPQKAQLMQANIALEPATRYQLSFSALSSSGNQMAIYLHKHHSPFTNYGLRIKSVALTDTWQTFTYEFTTQGFTEPVNDARLRFWLTNENQQAHYAIDNVLLIARDGLQSSSTAGTLHAMTAQGGVAESAGEVQDVVELYNLEGEILAAILLNAAREPQQILEASNQETPSAAAVMAALEQVHSEATNIHPETEIVAIAMGAIYGAMQPIILFLPLVHQQ